MKRGGGKKAPNVSGSSVAGPMTETPSGQLGGSSRKSPTKIQNITSTGSQLTPNTGPVAATRGRKG
jgi:hypothetical protein